MGIVGWGGYILRQGAFQVDDDWRDGRPMDEAL